MRRTAYGVLGTISVLTFFAAVSNSNPFDGQTVQEKAQTTLQTEVNVFFKLVQAYVVDRKGNPVTDLTAADFEIADNGKAQKIEHFEMHQLAAAPAAAPADRPASPPPNPALRRKLFFVFNFAFIEPAGILKGRKAALEFMDNYVHPTDEIGIITYSMTRGLKINEFLTTDHRRIRAMIEGLGMKSTVGRAEQIVAMFARGINQYVNESDAVVPESARQGEFEEAREMLKILTAAEAKTRPANYNQSVAVFLMSLRSLARGLSLIPGNKNLVLFSNGIAGASLFGAPTVNLPDTLNTVEEMIQWQDGLSVKDGDSRLREIFQTVNTELRAANCPVFSFNVSGTQLTNDVEGFGSSDENALGMKARDTVGNDSLKVMSSQTGGQYFSYSMDLKTAVERFQKTTNTYYVLGYSLPATYDGKYHKIKIKVNRKGCDVLGESGYFNPKPFAQYSDFEKFIHVLELAEGGTPHLQAGIDFSLAAYPIPMKDKVAVALYAALPAEKFKALGTGPAEVVTILFNARDQISVYKKTPLYITALTEDTVFIDQASGLPPGTYDCRVVVRSLDSGRGASAATTVIIPRPSASPGLTLYPAHLFKPGLRARYQGDSGALASIYPFNMSGSAPLSEGLTREAAKIQIVVPCAVVGIQEPDLALTVSLVNVRTKEASPLVSAIKNRYSGPNRQTMLVEVDVPTLVPGPYSLVVDAEEKTSGLKSQAVTNFVVR